MKSPSWSPFVLTKSPEIKKYIYYVYECIEAEKRKKERSNKNYP
jgi:hypothetical protein